VTDTETTFTRHSDLPPNQLRKLVKLDQS